MESLHIESFDIIGISVKTDNSDPVKLTNDMQGLWNKFLSENIMDKIPNKVDHNIYCIYTDYEGDYTKPYRAILGCRVSSLAVIPDGLSDKSIQGGSYNKFIAKGNILHGMIFEKWKQIWGLDIARSYTTDFEVYGEKSRNPEDAEVEIFIGIKSHSATRKS
jgi:predicted transcriptional regulator YdeE